MADLPEVKPIRLDREIHAVLREFYGPYEDAPKYVTEVTDYLEKEEIPYKQYNVLGVYFGDPQNDKPEDLRSYQGVLVDEEQDVQEPYFNYSMQKGEYLYTRVSGKPEDVIPQAYLALFNYMGLKKIQAGSSGGHQVVTMENGQVVFEIYLEID